MSRKKTQAGIMPGVVASGHAKTSEAGRLMLEAGGNAFDAVLASLCTACVCEPLFTSLGGGGFLMARETGREPRLFDFFVQTPQTKKPSEELDFYPILADFGATDQEFHVGLGSMAVPGLPAGITTVHEKLCTLPLSEIVEPAIQLAREGWQITRYQSYVNRVLRAILNISPEAMATVAPEQDQSRPAEPGERSRRPELADSLEALGREGSAWFYEGEVARMLTQDSASKGGQLTSSDMESYGVIERSPITLRLAENTFYLNPPPSPGGSMVAFALALLGPVPLEDSEWGSSVHGQALVSAMAAASRMRRESGLDRMQDTDVAALLEEPLLAHWRDLALPSALFSRGTTHISAVDGAGNLASLTSSNGEGCGYVVPGTGIMMNNMLGEEDLNPDGFHAWPPGSRLASMMSPTLALDAGGAGLALGSGGSNRIRSAVLQVLINVFRFHLPLDQAVEAPRLHLEGSQLSLEPGFSAERELLEHWPDQHNWSERNLFFGGVHAVHRTAQGELTGAGDPRRGGAVARVGG